ncbi:MAG: hypothetical protein C4531_08875 [Desulfurivibrio sp.]|nr:MAG: hypothetical protein C4531_08875 [Desulfurivibrio sp.]
MAGQVNANRSTGSESFRVWVPDFDEWPESWMGVEEDLAYGRKLLPWFSGFLQALYAEGMSRKTFRQYRDNLWLLGATIIREVSLYEEYQDDPLEKLAETVADDGILPDDYDQMTEAELRAFERMCRRFEKYLGESK